MVESFGGLVPKSTNEIMMACTSLVHKKIEIMDIVCLLISVKCKNDKIAEHFSQVSKQNWRMQMMVRKGKVIYGSPLTEDLAYPTNRGFQLSANFCQSNPNTTNCCNLIPQGPGQGGWSLVSKEV